MKFIEEDNKFTLTDYTWNTKYDYKKYSRTTTDNGQRTYQVDSYGAAARSVEGGYCALVWGWVEEREWGGVEMRVGGGREGVEVRERVGVEVRGTYNSQEQGGHLERSQSSVYAPWPAHDTHRKTDHHTDSHPSTQAPESYCSPPPFPP